MKSGYKQTEVGVIPEDWEVRRLSQLADIRGGIAINSNVPPVDAVSVHYLRVANVQDGFLDLSEMSQIQINRKDIARYRVLSGDVLMNEGGDLDKLGRGAIWLGQFNPCVHQNHVFVVRCKAGMHPDYLNIWTSTSPARRFFLYAGKQTTNLASISKTSLGQLPVALPPLPEQRAIAGALSEVDALLGAQEALIAKKRDLKQAAMQQLLTGQKRLPSFTGEWQVNSIQELAQVGRGRVISHIEISKSPSPTYPVFSSQTSNQGVMGYLDTYDFEGDYVTWTTDGANAGTVFARSGRFNCTNVCGTIKLHNSDHRFIAAALDRVAHAHVSRHLGNPKLMNDVMKKITVLIPSSKAEQTAIAAVLSDMDAEIAALEAQRDKTRTLKQGMMQELLTGRIRLV